MKFPKRQYVRSQALIEACRRIPCQFDQGDISSPILRLCLAPMTCACHSNWEIHGKGWGIKADDNRVASGCHVHHSMLDQGKAWSEDERKARWWRAHVRTVNALLLANLWPRRVPVPDIACCPFDVAGATT